MLNITAEDNGDNGYNGDNDYNGDDIHDDIQSIPHVVPSSNL